MSYEEFTSGSSLGPGLGRHLAAGVVIVVLLVSCLALCVTLLGQSQGASSDAVRNRIVGTVVGSDDGRPVEGVAIRLYGPDATLSDLVEDRFVVTTSDATGRFEFRDLYVGEYRLEPEVPGMQGAFSDASRVLSLTKSLPSADIEIRVRSRAVVSGRVTSASGEAVGGAEVSLVKLAYIDGARRGTNVFDVGARALSSENGEYSISAAPGQYYLRITRGQGTSVPGVPQYFPGTFDLASAAEVVLPPGASLPGVDVQLLHAAGYRVAFALRFIDIEAEGAEDGPATLSADIHRIEAGSIVSPPFRMKIERVGRDSYQLPPLPPAEYDIQIAMSGDVRTPISGRIAVSRDSIARVTAVVNDSDVNLGALTPNVGANVVGRVIVEGRQPILWAAAPPLMLTETLFDRPIRTARVRDAGTFAFGPVPGGHYRLTLAPDTLPDGLFVEGAYVGGEHVLSDGLSIAPEMAELTVNLVISENAARIGGAVQDSAGNRVANAMVVMIPSISDRGPLTTFRTALSDDRGEYFIGSVRPGEYRLIALDARGRVGAVRVWEDPQFLDRMEFRGGLIRLQPGGRRVVDVELLVAGQ